MEIIINDNHTIFLATIVLFLITLPFLRRIFHSKPSKQFPPGRSSGWAVIGETLEFFTMGKRGALEKFYNNRMDKYSSNVFSTSLFGTKMVVLCGPKGNKMLFSNENKLVRVWWPQSLRKLFPYASEIENILSNHESTVTPHFRNMVVNLAKPDLLRKYIGIMDSVSRKHLNQWDCLKVQDSVIPLIKQFNIALACRLFLSIEEPENTAKYEKRLSTLVAGVLSFPVDLPGTPLNRAIKASNSMRKEIQDIIAQRKELSSPGPDDLLTYMLTDEQGKFTNSVYIADKIVALIFAGNDTISVTITLIMKYLAELPHVYYNVLKELREVELGKAPDELLTWVDLQKMKYTWNVACEVMRLAPPVFGTFREAIIDFTFDGVCIPEGTKLHWGAYTTHKNPEFFPQPENFEPSRFDDNGPIPHTYVPFGGGPRMCPGQEYARLEILAFMYNVVRKFRWEKVIPDEKIIVYPVVKPTHGLPLRLYHN